MNISSLVGFILAGIIVWLGAISRSPKPQIFFDAHALIIVVGGTIAAGLIAFPLRRILNLVDLVLLGVLFKKKPSDTVIVNELIEAAAIGKENLDVRLNRRDIPHYFIREGYYLISEGLLTDDELLDVLSKRSETFRRTYLSDAKMLTALAKFPPAFGLLGASTGMINMMTNLGKNGTDSIGPAMGIALVATFWGIALANLVLLPLADYASKLNTEDQNTRQIIIEGLMMIKRGFNETVVARALIGMLPIGERVNFKDSKRTPTGTHIAKGA